MLVELARKDLLNALDLFAPLRFQLSSVALLEGRSPGRVWVDNAHHPHSGFMRTVEVELLAGNPANDAFNAALGAMLRAEKRGRLYLVVESDAWIEALPAICGAMTRLPTPRRHFVCHAATPDWRARVPDGFAVRQIDAALLDTFAIPQHVTDWINHNWGGRDQFLQHGFGFVTLAGDQLVAWSLADCVTATGCEIGIHTEMAFRRRGLATITTAATADHALASGLSSVGWHCDEDNLGSIGTASNAGFDLERHYTSHYISLSEG